MNPLREAETWSVSGLLKPCFLLETQFQARGASAPRAAPAADLLERSAAGLPPQFGQFPLRGADEQAHREVEGLLVAEAASLFRNHPDSVV